MAYTYNDVQNSKAAPVLDEDSSETGEDSLDLERWVALQQAYMSSTASPSADLGTDSVVSAAEMGINHVNSIGAAAARLSEAQSVANIHILNDNFIRDSITGK